MSTPGSDDVTGFAYAAFLSYSRQARPAFVDALHAELQRVGKPWRYRRARRVFRDTYTGEPSGDLTSSLVTALDASQSLVLLGSPAAAASSYVNDEISHWLKTRGRENLFIAIIEREPGADRTNWRAVVPPALRDGPEPWWADLSHMTERAATAGVPEFADLVAGIAAAVEGPAVAKDDLVAEDLRQFRKGRAFRRITIAVLAAFAVAATTLAAVAVSQTQLANRRARQAQSRQQASEALVLADSDYRAALASARDGLDLHRNRQTEGVMLQLLDEVPALESGMTTKTPISAADIVASGEFAVFGLEDGSVLLSKPTGAARTLAENSGDAVRHISTDDAHAAVVWDDGRVALLAIDSGVVVWSGWRAGAESASPGCGPHAVFINHDRGVEAVGVEPEDDRHVPIPDRPTEGRVAVLEDCSVRLVGYPEVLDVDLIDGVTARRRRPTPAQIGGMAEDHGGDIDALGLYRTNVVSISDISQPTRAGSPRILADLETSGTDLIDLAVSKQGNRVAALYGSTIDLFDLDRPDEPLNVFRGVDPASRQVLLDESGTRMITTTADEVQWWDTEAENRLSRRVTPNAETFGATARVVDVVYAPGGDYLAWTGVDPTSPLEILNVAVLDRSANEITWLDQVGVVDLAWLDSTTLAIRTADDSRALDLEQGTEEPLDGWPERDPYGSSRLRAPDGNGEVGLDDADRLVLRRGR